MTDISHPGGWQKTRSRAQKMFSGVSGLIMSTFSPFLLGVGYVVSLVVPTLAEAVHIPPPDGIAWPMLGLLVLGGLFTAPEIIFVTDSVSAKRDLQWNDIIDKSVALAITGVGTWLFATNHLAWWYLPGWIFSIINTYASGWFSMNTLFSKNPTQMQRGE